MKAIGDCCAGDGLIPLEDALERVDQVFGCRCGSESVDLDRALGRILAADLVSTVQVPAFANSAMDGYGLRHGDLSTLGPAPRLRIVNRVAAGEVSTELLPSGGAVRIFTGAPLPPGVDTVVMQERCEAGDGHVIVPPDVRCGDNVRPAGGDVGVGEVVLPAGRFLAPQDIGMAAAVGMRHLEVRQALRVAVVSTGDELRDAPQPLPHGAIYDSNRRSVAAVLRRFGCQVTDLGILPDRRKDIERALAEASQGHDLIVTSGGMSVGEEDHVKPAVMALGDLGFWRVALKPGKPVAIGSVGAAVFLGLPGNPVSALVTLLLLGRPLLLRLAGASVSTPTGYEVAAGFRHRVKGGRREFARGFIEARPGGGSQARIVDNQSSGALSSMVQASGLVDLGSAAQVIQPGDRVRYIPFAEFLP